MILSLSCLSCNNIDSKNFYPGQIILFFFSYKVPLSLFPSFFFFIIYIIISKKKREREREREREVPCKRKKEKNYLARIKVSKGMNNPLQTRHIPKKRQTESRDRDEVTCKRRRKTKLIHHNKSFYKQYYCKTDTTPTFHRPQIIV